MSRCTASPPTQAAKTAHLIRETGQPEILAILDVPDTLLKEGDDVFIIDAIEDFFSIAASLDQMHLAQTAHVMRDRRFADPGHLGQGADVHLAAGQGRQDADTAGVAESTEQFRHMRRGVFIKNGGKIGRRYQY